MKFNTPPAFLCRPINILIIGAGGTGSQISTELFQMDFLLRELSNNEVYLNVTIADGDTVSRFNVGRQCFYANDIGFNKAEVLVNRFNNFGNSNWKAIPAFLKTNFDSRNYQIVITAIDKAKFRYELGKAKKNSSSNTLWIDIGNAENTGQVIMGHLGMSENKIPNVYDLYKEALNVEDNDSPSCSTQEALAKQDFGVNRSVSLHASQLIWQLLRHGGIEHHGVYVDLKNGSTQSMPIDPKQWAVFGY